MSPEYKKTDNDSHNTFLKGLYNRARKFYPKINKAAQRYN